MKNLLAITLSDTGVWTWRRGEAATQLSKAYHTIIWLKPPTKEEREIALGRLKVFPHYQEMQVQQVTTPA